MTQSGVSQHVRKLEEQLGQALLIRQGKRFILTSAGNRLYKEGQALIVSLADLENRIGLDPAYEVVVPSWDQLIDLGFVGHPDGAYHAGQLLSVNFSEFHNSNQFKRSGFSNQINLILEPVGMGLGFTVLPSYAVGAFKAANNIRVHRLSNRVSETLYVGTHPNKFVSSCVKTVISTAEACLSDH